MTAARISLWGRVLDGNGNPLPGAELFWVDEEHATGETTDLLHVHKVGEADAEGRFWAAGLPEGPGLLVPDFRRVGVANFRFRLDRGTRLRLPMAEGAEDIVLRFPATPAHFTAVRGEIRDGADGAPVAGHPIGILDAEGKGTFKRDVLTGADGTFLVKPLDPGRYLLVLLGTDRFLPSMHPIEPEAGKVLTLRAGLQRRPPGPLHRFRVRVTTRLGIPIPGAGIALQANNYAIPVMTADAEGTADSVGCAVRPGVALASAEGFWPAGAAVPPGEAGGLEEVAVTLEEASVLLVSARDGRTKRPRRHANCRVAGGGGYNWQWGGGPPPPDAPAEEGAAFPVRAGEVRVSAESPGYRRADRVVRVEAGEDPEPVVIDMEAREGGPG